MVAELLRDGDGISLNAVDFMSHRNVTHRFLFVKRVDSM